ncbi:MAG: hypothetical protein IJM50_01385 [Lachnospiraceae bacterium]|nr:hypothetical protein [Lachnospiraceae bacterium]
MADKKEYFRRWMERHEKEMNEDPLFDEVLKRKEEHGLLTGVCFRSWSSGMMMYSGSEKETALLLDNEEVRFTARVFADLDGGTKVTYRVDPGTFQKAENLCEENNLFAWAALKAHIDPRFVMTDVSGGASLVLTYDDTALGGYKENTRSIDLNAVPPKGKAILNELQKIMEEGRASGELILEEKLMPKADRNTLLGIGPGGSYPGDPGKPGTARKDPKEIFAPDGTWTCPECGNSGNEGRFCPQCGSRRPNAGTKQNE